MPRRWMPVAVGVVASVLVAACGGGDDSDSAGSGGQSATSTTARAAPTTTTTQPAIEGVQVHIVEPSHAEGRLSYPQTPPVGGVHNPVWQPCTFYDQPVPSERAVHSLEHGAIWITYRPDLPTAEVEVLASLARSRKDVIASRWDDGLPAPVVVTGWGRQLYLQAATDPRLLQFVRTYVNQAPEPNAPC